MKMRTLAAPGMAVALLFSAGGCGEDDDANVNGSGGGGSDEYEFVDPESWDACEIFNDLEAIIDFYDIEEVRDHTDHSEEGPRNSAFGTDVDAASASCLGLAIYAIDPDSDTFPEVEGDIVTRVSPYPDLETAEEWFAYNVDEMLATEELDENDEFDFVHEEVEGDWDHGEFVYYEMMNRHTFDVVVRDANLVVGVRIIQGKRGEDQGLVDVSPEEVQEWLLNTYIHDSHQAAVDHVNEEN